MRISEAVVKRLYQLCDERNLTVNKNSKTRAHQDSLVRSRSISVRGPKSSNYMLCSFQISKIEQVSSNN